jgi:hypothetical protein
MRDDVLAFCDDELVFVAQRIRGGKGGKHVHGEKDYLNGPLRKPQIYDQRSGSFITPK